MANLDKISGRMCPPARAQATDLGLLALRLTAGGLLAGHGAQKLFGAFGGHGLEGTAGWLESLGLRPGKPWAVLAGLSEFGGGALTALGLGGPIGPLALQGAMATAARKAHWGKPIWVTAGGAEVPALYSAAGIALALAGPGRYSLDRALGVALPKAVAAVTAAAVVAGIVLADRQSPPAQEAEPAAEEAAMEGPEGGEDRVLETRPAVGAPEPERATAADEATRAEGATAAVADLQAAHEATGEAP